ncbi:coiled-coil domain-containing protein 42 [Chlamydotis macqueenii]
MASKDDEDLLDYFHTFYRQNLLSLLRKLGLTEEDFVSPLIRLQEKKKQAKWMHKALEVKEEAFKEKMKVLTCQWRDLHTKDAQQKTSLKKSGRILKVHLPLISSADMTLSHTTTSSPPLRDSLGPSRLSKPPLSVEWGKHHQENDEIRIQALNKAIKEREGKMQKESELLRAKKELEVLRKKHQKLRNMVQKYSIFNKYLEDVVKISQFEEIQDVIWRCKTLMRIHKDLLQSQQSHKEMIEQAKVLLDQYMADKEAEILQYQDELVQLQLRFDQAQSDVLPWETRWADIQNTAAEKTLRLGTIKMAILNLFQCMSLQLKANLNVPVDDSHGQLNTIQPFIQDLTAIWRELKGDAERTDNPALAPIAVVSSDFRRRRWLVNPTISTYPGLGTPSAIRCQMAKA